MNKNNKKIKKTLNHKRVFLTIGSISLVIIIALIIILTSKVRRENVVS